MPRASAGTRPLRIAVIGGDRRHGRIAWPATLDVRTYGSAGDGGAGELRRLVVSIKAGEVELVVALARWIGHSATTVLRRTCRQTGVRFLVWDRGVGSLVEKLATLAVEPPR